MKYVNSLEKKVLELIPVLEESNEANSEGSSKSYNKVKNLPLIIENRVKDAVKIL